MAGGWGSKKNRVRIGVFWDGISITGATAKITDPHINIDRDVNISDSANNLSWSGGAVVNGSDANINVSGSGDKRIKTVTAEAVPLSYGSTVSRNFAASFSGINYAGSTLTVSKSVTYPARPYSIPAAPTIGQSGLATPAATSIAVQWANNGTAGSNSSAPYTGLYVERQANDEPEWTIVSPVLASNALSWTDSNIFPNSRYRYRVRARNSAGVSGASTETPWIMTIPEAPVPLAPAKSGGDITVHWSNAGTPYYSGTEIRAYRPYPTQTHTYTAVAPAASRADDDEDLGEVQRYGLAHYVSAVPLATGGTVTLYSAEVLTTTISADGAPLAPEVTLSGAVFDANEVALTVTWEHKPVDGSAQTGARIRYRVAPAGAWSTPVEKTTETSHSFPTGTFANENTYEVQVQTKGVHADYGPYGSPGPVFTTSARPEITISPSDGAIITAPLITLTVAFLDPGADDPPTAWQVELRIEGTGELLYPGDGDTEVISSADNPWVFQIPYPVSDLTLYNVRVRAADAVGLWSDWETCTYTVVFPVPVGASIVGGWCVPETGQVNLAYSVDEPTAFDGGYGDDPYGSGPYGGGGGGGGGGQIAAARATVQRFTGGVWIDICTNDFTGEPLSPGVWGCVDHIPPLGGIVTYRVVTESSIPTSFEGSEFLVDCMIPLDECTYPDGMRLFLNAGEDWSTRAVIVGEPAVKESLEREKVLVTPVGRTYPIELIGIALDERYSISGVVARDALVPIYLARLGATRDDWASIAVAAAPICYRDPFGRRVFGSIGAVQTDWGTTPVSTVSATLTVTGGGES